MSQLGLLMQAETGEAPGAFARALSESVSAQAKTAIAALGIASARAFYTVARGSSDAACGILAYEYMRELGRPTTSLPPSVFSLGAGVDLTGSAVVLVSQSGASEDLVRSAEGARSSGAAVVALVNKPDSPVEAKAALTLPLLAGPERAVPATKSVVAAIGAGMALLGTLSPSYAARAAASGPAVAALADAALPQAAAIVAALAAAPHIYVIGRDTGFGAAQELALKLKETCALHAEAYSSSEVLHGPLQLATKSLLALVLDTGQHDIQNSLDTAENRLRATGANVFRIRPADAGAPALVPAAAAAALLCLTYPLVLATARALGVDPDHPTALSKVTQTR